MFGSTMRSHVTVVSLLAATLCQAYPSYSPPAGAIYNLYNNKDNASIVATAISANGSLYGSPVLTATGGKGGTGQNGPGQPNVGALFTQNAITGADGYLFSVNPGSNTVSMFSINPNNPLELTLVGEPADTKGDFPVSVAYSSALSMLCVLNGGKTSGVTCFNVDSKKGLSTNETAPRSLGSGFNETTPPTGPFSSASDIVFNPSSSALFVSTKGTPLTKPIQTGYIYVFPVENGQVSQSPVANHLDSVVLDFSMTFLGTDFSLIVTDPALGADFLAVDSSNWMIEVVKPVNVTYQKAVCWSHYDTVNNVIFLSDAAQSNITVLNPEDGSIMQTINFNPSDGAQDMITVGNSLYAVSSKGPLLRFDISGIQVGTKAVEMQMVDGIPASELKDDLIVGIAAYQTAAASSWTNWW